MNLRDLPRLSAWTRSTRRRFRFSSSRAPISSAVDAVPAAEPLQTNADWKPPTKTPTGFYRDLNNQKLFFEWAGKKLGAGSMESWYQIPAQRICDIGGESIMKKHSYSMHKALQTVYPGHVWLPWLFMPITSGLWKSEETKKQYLEWLERKLAISRLEDWYDVTMDALREFGGDRLIHTEHGGSLLKFLEAAYPSHQWKPWLFRRVAQNFWNDRKNQRDYFDWLFSELGLKSMDDWYGVTVRSVRDRGGNTLLWKYSDSLIAALFYTYPEHSWNLLEYHKMPQNFWSTPKRRRILFDWIGRQLGINTPEDWYLVSLEQIEKLGQTQTFKLGLLGGKFGSFSDALAEVYPHHSWDPWRFKYIHVVRTPT